MRNIFKKWKCRQKRFVRMASDNEEAIQRFNEKMLRTFSHVALILIMLPVLTAHWNEARRAILPTYLGIAACVMIINALFRYTILRQRILWGFYFGYSFIFLVAIYLSVFHMPGMRATILLGLLTIMPMSFMDHPIRMNLFALFWFVVHTLLSFHWKPEFLLDDTVNCFCFLLLGCYFGNRLLWSRLESFEMSRQLKMQRDTDALTGLYSRRKLFEYLESLSCHEQQDNMPCGMFMINIDDFKQFNDTYGHVAGDQYLSSLGSEFLKFQHSYDLEFTVMAAKNLLLWPSVMRKKN